MKSLLQISPLCVTTIEYIKEIHKNRAYANFLMLPKLIVILYLFSKGLKIFLFPKFLWSVFFGAIQLLFNRIHVNIARQAIRGFSYRVKQYELILLSLHAKCANHIHS